MNKQEKYDNLHILLWLIKDMCWSIENKLGVIFIAPTIGVAIWLFIKSETTAIRYHNLAICFWITANSLWMISELYKFVHATKPIVITLFIAGLFTLVAYYIKLLLFKQKA